MAHKGTSVVIISGQKHAGEVVVAASVFLDIGLTSITPVSTNKNIVQELFLSLEVFKIRESFSHFRSEYYAKQIIKPNENKGMDGFLWLALDEQGYSTAKDIFSKNGLSSDEKVYRSVCKLNLLEQITPPYPETAVSIKFWQQIYGELNRVGWDHRRTKSQKGRRKLFEQYVPMSSKEKEYYSWYKLLHDSLTPWRETISNIEFDWS